MPIWREQFGGCNGRVFMIKSFFHGEDILKRGFENIFRFWL
jgi:hypothetical protein